MAYQRKTDRYYPTREEVASWPPDHRRCTSCLEVKPLTEFHKNNRNYLGVDAVCKICRKPHSKNEYAKRRPELLLWQRAKGRAKRKGLDFNIEVSDVVIPERCPVLGVVMTRGTREDNDNAPSLDRYDSRLGYVKGNVVVISTKANKIKGSATVEELQALVRWMALEDFKRSELVGI